MARGNKKTGAGANELRRSFKFFDRDSSGTIDHLEFQEAIKSLLNIYLSEDLAKKALVEFDADGNGEVDYQEFCNLVMKSNKQDSTSLNTKLSKEASMCAPARHACALSLILILVRPLLKLRILRDSFKPHRAFCQIDGVGDRRRQCRSEGGCHRLAGKDDTLLIMLPLVRPLMHVPLI